jgi:DNA mismatch repair protein MutS
MQLTLFGIADHPLLDELRRLQLDSLTPIEAFQFLQSAQAKLADPNLRPIKAASR